MKAADAVLNFPQKRKQQQVCYIFPAFKVEPNKHMQGNANKIFPIVFPEIGILFNGLSPGKERW